MPHQRITIWGNSGSGKSTLAESAGQELRLPVFHLDLIAWEAGWRFRDEAAFLEEQSVWLKQPGWIIEGVGDWHGLVERFHRADLIVHLDIVRLNKPLRDEFLDALPGRQDFPGSEARAHRRFFR